MASTTGRVATAPAPPQSRASTATTWWGDDCESDEDETPTFGRNPISECFSKSLNSYALHATTREPIELCPRFKSLPSVSRRDLSANLAWCASRSLSEFPAPETETRSGCASRERGVKNKIYTVYHESQPRQRLQGACFRDAHLPRAVPATARAGCSALSDSPQ